MFWSLAVFFAADSEQQLGSLTLGVPTLKKKTSRWCITAYSDALKQVCCVCLTHTPTSWQSFHHLLTHLWLTVVLQRHGDDIDADDEGDDQVQVVAGTQSVDSQPGWTV